MPIDTDQQLDDLNDRYGHTWYVWRSDVGNLWATRRELLSDHTLNSTGLMQTVGGVAAVEDLTAMLDDQGRIAASSGLPR